MRRKGEGHHPKFHCNIGDSNFTDLAVNENAKWERKFKSDGEDCEFLEK